MNKIEKTKIVDSVKEKFRADQRVLPNLNMRGYQRNGGSVDFIEEIVEHTIAALEEQDLLEDTTEYIECKAELHSWDYFGSNGSVDPYYMKCHLTYPHSEHENSETGAKWLDSAEGAY